MTLTQSSPDVDDRSTGSSRRLSVVHLLHTVAYGGIETVIINWIRHADRQQFDLTLVVFENPGGGGTEQPFVETAERAGLSVRKICWGRLKPIRRSARQLRRILDEVQADVLHAHNTYADVVGWYATRNTSIKTVASLYVWSDFGWKRNVLQKIDEWVLRRFDLIATQCEQTRRDTISRGLPPDKTKVLVNGYEPDPIRLTDAERRDARRERGVEDGQVVLAHTARLYPEKAHDIMLRCFRKIVAERPHARLWIVGSGPLLDEVASLRRELDIEESVKMCGFVKDLPACLRCVDIQVHPSHAEGVPIAICTGMATGLPIVASDVGGIWEMIKDGVTGVLVPPAGEEGFRQRFIDAVIRLIDDVDERRRLGQAARDFIANDYSLTNATKQLENAYRQLVNPCESASS